MKIESTYPVVWVEWVDSFSGRNGWEDIDAVVEAMDTGSGNEIVSVGLLIHENDKWLTLTSSVALGSATVTSQCDNPMTIPKCCIKKRYTVEFVK